MKLFQALVLGVLQGVTEFIPISSSGHLVLVPWLLGWEDSGLTFNVVVHLGTLVAVLAFFWRDILRLVAAWWQSLWRRDAQSVESKVAWCIIVGTIPAGVLGYLFDDLLESLFYAPAWVAGFLLVTGTILAISERLGRRTRGLPSLSWLDAVLIGLGQALAIVPGISRSGATIAAGLMRGLERDVAARFSFLLSVPIIAAVGVFALRDLASASSGGGTPAMALLVGFLAAALSGYLCIRFLLSYVRSRGLYPFAIYCWCAGLVGLAVAWLR